MSIDFKNDLQNVDIEYVTKGLDAINQIEISKQCYSVWEIYKNGNFIEAISNVQVLLDVAWEHLNTGHWKDVNISWRYLYTFASFIKCLCLVENRKFVLAIRACDMGLLMGAPLFDNILAIIVKKINLYYVKNVKNENIDIHTESPCKKVKLENPVITKLQEIQRIDLPSLISFKNNYMLSELPVIIRNATNHWPAFSSRRWSVDYIKKIAGTRTVPIEVGEKYTSDNWTQKLLTVSDFIDKYICLNDSSGYLAQHQLFEQIPELRDDICIPDYCCLSDRDNNCVMTHAWFGPMGTISPLHHDPYNNLFVQVLGKKYIRLYNHIHSDYVYPHTGTLLDNTSQVDVEGYDAERFPLFEKASYLECILNEGEMLYIPPKWWHYVRSLDTSFSISFWW